MGHLMYSTSAGDIAVDRAALHAVETPEPLGSFHFPVDFGFFVDQVEHSLDTHGLSIVAEEHAITKDRQSFFSVIEVDAKEGVLTAAGDWRMLVGLRGSHNQRTPREIVVGNKMLVCSNLCFSADLGKFSTRQTTNIWDRLPELIDIAVRKIPAAANVQTLRIERYKDFGLKPAAGDALLTDMVRHDALAPSAIKRALKEWDDPSYEEHAAEGRTAWRLLNAVTEAQKPTGSTYNMHQIADRTATATRLLDTATDFAMAA